MTVALLALTAGVLAGWVARSHRAHVLRRRQLLAAALRHSNHPATDRRALVARVDLGMWDAECEASLPAHLRRKSSR